MYSNFSESEERIAARKARILATGTERSDTEILAGIVEKMETAIGIYEQTTAAIEGLNAIGAAMKAGKLSRAETVHITNKLNDALELAGVKIDGTQPARQPATPARFILRGWAVYAATIVIVLFVLSVLSAVIR